MRGVRDSVCGRTSLPSRYLAQQIAATYGLELDSIHVLPYPVGDWPLVDRANKVWNSHALA